MGLRSIRLTMLRTVAVAGLALPQVGLAQSRPAGDDTTVSAASQAGPARAGETGSGPAPADAGGGATVGDIVVTAQRRTERLQQVPISAEVVTGAAIEAKNITSLNTLVQTIPSVHISGVGGGGRSNELFIRGIGSGGNQVFDQSVGTFIDDVFHGRSRTSSGSFLDLERVEVLKGPQSTFFGNNAIAGAFNIITRKPGDEFGGSFRALYGEHGQYALTGAAGGPITDTLGIRVATSFDGIGGWLKNINTGTSAPKEDNIVGRVTLVFKPADAFDVTAKYEASTKKNIGGWAAQVDSCPPPAPFVANGFCATRLAQGLPTGLANNAITSNAGEGGSLNTQDAALTLNYRLGGHTLTAVTGYYKYDSQLLLDGDFTPTPLLHINSPEHYHQFSQELRLTSPAGQPIEYVVGGYYQDDTLNLAQEFSYFFLTPQISSVPAFAPLAPLLPLAQSIQYRQRERSYAAFGSLTWNVTDRLKLSGGLRATWVDKSFTQNILYGTVTRLYDGVVPFPAALQPLAQRLNLGVPETLSGDRHDHALLPSGRLQYQLDRDVMAYASYARGFKAGGFNGIDTSGNPNNLPYNPELVNAYEIGLKSEFLNRRVLLNLAVFRSDYSDLQVTTTVTTGNTVQTVVANAAAVRSQGVEAEAELAISRAFRVSGAVSYLNARYRNYPNASLNALQTFCRAAYNASYCGGLPNPVPAAQNLSGRPTQYAPDWSGSVTASYAVELGAGFRATAEGTGIFSSRYFLTNTDDPLTSQGAYGKVDARLTLDKDGGRWSLAVIGKNLNNKIIKTVNQIQPTTTASTYAAHQEPRNVAVQLSYRW